MSNFGEDGLQKLVSMNLFVPETCSFVLGTLKIGGGGALPVHDRAKNLFLAKKWPFLAHF